MKALLISTVAIVPKSSSPVQLCQSTSLAFPFAAQHKGVGFGRIRCLKNQNDSEQEQIQSSAFEKAAGKVFRGKLWFAVLMGSLGFFVTAYIYLFVSSGAVYDIPIMRGPMQNRAAQSLDR